VAGRAARPEVALRAHRAQQSAQSESRHAPHGSRRRGVLPMWVATRVGHTLSPLLRFLSAVGLVGHQRSVVRALMMARSSGPHARSGANRLLLVLGLHEPIRGARRAGISTPSVHRNRAGPLALLVVRLPQVRVAVAWASRACVGLDAVRSAGVQASLRVDREQQPASAALTIELASPARRQVLSPRRHGHAPFVPLLRPPGRQRARTPEAVNQIEARSPGRWDDARRSTAPAPQSKPVAQASRLVAQTAPSVAHEPGLRILAAGPALSTLLRSRALVGPNVNDRV